MLTFLFNR